MKVFSGSQIFCCCSTSYLLKYSLYHAELPSYSQAVAERRISFMSDEFNKSGCTPSDCASCTANCESKVDEAHHTITLTMDDDTEVECAILTIFPVENKEYIALLPLDENGQNETGEVYLYSFSRTADGDPMLANIEDDEEYDAVANAFNAVVEKARADEEADAPLS